MSKEIRVILGIGVLWLVLCVAVLSLSGCYAASSESEKPPISVNGSMNADVYEIHLSDGTRCAVLAGVGNDRSGISCDWQH